MDQRIFSFKYKVHNWFIGGRKIKEVRSSFKIQLKISSNHSSKSSAKSSSSSKSRSSTKAKAIEEKVKVAESMMEASFIKKWRDAECQTWLLMVEEELGLPDTYARKYLPESIVGKISQKEDITVGSCIVGTKLG